MKHLLQTSICGRCFFLRSPSGNLGESTSNEGYIVFYYKKEASLSKLGIMVKTKVKFTLKDALEGKYAMVFAKNTRFFSFFRTFIFCGIRTINCVVC
jgi:hypothetical protein